MIKSLATGQTMKVYLDEPTQEVRKGVNVTRYTGHFYEEQFMVTWSDGIEITGLPFMYPYISTDLSDDAVVVIDTENHYYSEKFTELTDSTNLALGPYGFGFIDSPWGSDAISNAVEYEFSRLDDTSTGVEPEEPFIPIDPGEAG